MSRFLQRAIQIACFLVPIGMIIGAYFFLSKLPPPPTSDENIGYIFYLDKNYKEAIRIWREVASKKSANLDFYLTFADALLANGDKLEAETLLERLYRRHSDHKKVILALASAKLENKKIDEALALLEKLQKKESNNPKFYLLLAEAYIQKGENLRAAEIYFYMVKEGLDTQEAEKKIGSLFGYSESEIGKIKSFSLPAPRKREKGSFDFRTYKDFFEARINGQWRKTYLKGTNLSAAAPGYYVSGPPREFEIYEEWLKLIAGMNCNVVRMYTLCSPAFYQALKAHNEKSEDKIWLFQEIWLPEREIALQSIKEVFNLYDPSWIDEFKQEIQYVIDVIHGRGNVPIIAGRSGGIYLADVSEYVIGLGIGREIEPYLAIETNRLNPHQRRYEGRFVSIDEGDPIEIWFAQMCDFSVGYEMELYHNQHPVTVVNYPPLDPLHHPSEGDYREQNRWRERYGLSPIKRPREALETDTAMLDITKFRAHGEFQAGFFACYHCYPYWPDFMWSDKKYLSAKDSQGPNPLYGYIKELKEHHRHTPLVMGEYGMSTSWYPVYRALHSIDEGGYSYQTQAEWLVRITQNIYDEGYAGGIVFEFHDEWWHNSVPAKILTELHQKPLWFNVVDGESNFGLQTYLSDPPVPLLRGKKDDWEGSTELVQSKWKWHHPGELKGIYGASDFAFFYIRLDIENFKNDEWKEYEYWIALSTFPNKIGSQKLPKLDLHLEGGANFLIQLNADKKGRILIAKNYNIFEWRGSSPLTGEMSYIKKKQFRPDLIEDSGFEEFYFLTQSERIGGDGTIYPQLHPNWSELQYGTADPESRLFNNKAAWHIDLDAGMIEIRIPWMLLMITPSNRTAIFALNPDENGEEEVSYEDIDGIRIVAIAVDKNGDFQSLPKEENMMIETARTPMYSWKPWIEPPKYRTLLKESYFALQKLYKTLDIRDEGEEGP